MSGQSGGPMQQPQSQQPQRLVNGIPTGPIQTGLARPPSQYMPNGQLPNGVTVGMAPGMAGPSQVPGQPPQPGQPGQPMQPGAASMGFVGMGSNPHPGQQMNGVTGGPGGGPPSQPGGPPPPGQPGGQPPFGGMVPRGLNGMQGQPGMAQGPQRGGVPGAPVNGGAPFRSPTMAAGSPQGGPGQQGQPIQGGQAPMAQLGGPSPSPRMATMNSMNRPGGMLPPNGIPVGTPGQSHPSPQQQGPPTPGYPGQGPQQSGQPGQQPGQAGRPPSRTNTPRSGMMAHASPSLAPRNMVPGGMNMNMGNMGPMNMGLMGVPGMGGMSVTAAAAAGVGVGSNADGNLNQELMALPQSTMLALKAELNIQGDSSINGLTQGEKVGGFGFNFGFPHFQ
ncbi:hypothetical protein BJ165DRAFT_399739 [Panaeolus papilionaceus]|nr:hypothetical protein BJ165DRAFT_399739 [Panaeolus papilionaceus]